MADKKAPRRQIPAVEKAQRALDVVDRRIDLLVKKQAELNNQMLDTSEQLDELRKRRAYLAQNPDLPSHTEPTLPDEPDPEPGLAAD